MKRFRGYWTGSFKRVGHFMWYPEHDGLGRVIMSACGRYIAPEERGFKDFDICCKLCERAHLRIMERFMLRWKKDMGK